MCALHRTPARTRTPTHRVRTRYLHRPGRPIHASTASSFRTALVERPTAATTTYPLTVFPYRLSISAQYKKDTNYSKCIFRLASPTTSSTKKIDVPQNHESAHRPSLSLSLSLSLSPSLSLDTAVSACSGTTGSFFSDAIACEETCSREFGYCLSKISQPH